MCVTDVVIQALRLRISPFTFDQKTVVRAEKKITGKAEFGRTERETIRALTGKGTVSVPSSENEQQREENQSGIKTATRKMFDGSASERQFCPPLQQMLERASRVPSNPTARYRFQP